MRIIYPEEMQALDSRAIEGGIEPLSLMERAGKAVAEEARNMLSLCAGKRVVIVAARGKNGGDGLVAARYLRNWDAEVEIFLLDDPAELHPDSRFNLEKLKENGLETKSFDRETLQSVLRGADLVVDAIFGIGFRGTAGGVYGSAIELINAAERPVLAVDIPSGVDGKMGWVEGPAVEADCTVTFALPKSGLFLYPGAGRVGKLVVRDIGIPPHLVEEVVSSRIWAIGEEVEELYPSRPPDVHKGDCGKVLVVAGSTGLTGAAALASRAVLRSGAGVATLGIPASLNPVMEVKLTEVMTLPLPEDPPGHLSAEALPYILDALERFDVLALGPGLGLAESTRKLVTDLLLEVDKPVVLDADGLNCLREDPSLLGRREGSLVITPHPGELARLLGRSIAFIQRDRLSMAAEAARRFGCVVVLKGAHTIVADAEGELGINTSGCPGMATAGSGDVLTGCIATFLAQGLKPFDAARCGVYLHGKAGELAAHMTGEEGMVAGDIISHLPLARSRGRRSGWAPGR
jgi:NAD(P)H-hydrate epimerase